MSRIPDPLGPGQPAWNYAETAIAAWQEFKISLNSTRHHGRIDPNYRRYVNARHRMLAKVRQHGGDAAAWDAQLKLQREIDHD